MYDIKPLENEWKQYKRNKQKPYIYVFISVLSIMIGGIIFYNSNTISLPSFSKFSTLKPVESMNNQESSMLINKAISDIQIRKKEIIEEIKPTVKINVEKIEDESMPTLPVIDDIPVLESEPKRKTVRKKPKIVTKYIEKKKKPRRKMHLNIIESSSISAYKDVEKRFYESHDTDDSLFLAKSYFRKGNYKKSEYWALQTNKVNPNMEESWILFVKSKVKLGRKGEAIRVLENYVKRSNSNLAKNLLYKLKKN